MAENATLILKNGRFATMNPQRPFANAVAIQGERFLAVGSEDDIMRHQGPGTQVIDLAGRTVIPGLNDSHLHLIRGGLNYNLELRWDGVSSLAEALQMLKAQALRTPAPQWVRVVGGWSEFQFVDKRMPTLEEINQVSPDTPVFILHLYDRALLNAAAVKVAGFTKDSPNPPGGEIQRDTKGNPTGLIIAKPNAMILYSTLAKGPKLPLEYQINSTRHFMRELNRLGVTSCIDAGGGFQNYPEDYQVIGELHKNNQLTVRIGYNLFTQRPKDEYSDFATWITMTKPGTGDDYFRMNGAGEMLVFSAADFEDFLQPRPDLDTSMEDELKKVVRLLAENRWPFRLHATYNESIHRFLKVFEEVNRDVPFDGLRWFFDHAETITEANIERIRALGGGIAVQHRMAYQGEYFIDRYGKEAAKQTPPISTMQKVGIPVGAGTDATRVASYNPFVSLYWLSTGKTIGGTLLYDENNRRDRMEALRLYTQGSAWFSGEEDKKGTIELGKLADLAVLTADYFSIPDEEIKSLESTMTIVGGKIVYATQSFEKLSPPLPPVMPDWSPVKLFGGYARPSKNRTRAQQHTYSSAHHHSHVQTSTQALWTPMSHWWDAGCGCFAF